MTKQNELQEDFIQKGLDFYKTNKVGYFDLAMRFGKCRTTIEIVKNLHDYDCTILLAYPDNKLKETWNDEFSLWEYHNPNITYVNFSSLKKYTEEKFDVFVIDEFHSCSVNERDYCNDIINNCNKTIALSGTVSEDTRLDWNIPEIGKYTTLQGIKDGILADYTITVHLVDLDNSVKTKDSKGKVRTEKQKYDAYSWVIDKLIRERRNVMHLSLARNRLSLSSIGKMKHLQAILQQMESKRVVVFTGLSKVADGVGIPSYHSKSKTNDAFIDFQEGRENHLALAAMGKMGVTYPNLDSVILTNFVYNAEENAQILNRCIKLDYKDKIADMHILCLNEPAEIKKLREGLSLLDSSKIIWKS
jgi:hypothetical protein